VFEVLRSFAAPAANATLAGLITLDAGLPVMTLTVAPAIKASLGGYLEIDLTMSHRSVAARKSPDGPPVLYVVSMLEGAITFTHGSTPVVVPLSAPFTDPLSVLELRAKTGQAFDVGLSELTSWVGGADLLGALPAAFRPGAGLTLSEVAFAVGLRTGKLEYVSLTISATQPWPIVGKLSITGVELNFLVMPGGTPPLLVTVNGTIAIDTAAAIEITAQTPDFMISGHLPEGTPVKLAELIDLLGGVKSGLPDSLAIDVLSFSAHPAGSAYSFAIDVTGTWPIVKQLEVDQLKVNFDYDSGQLTALFAGLFKVGGVDLSISAEYDSDAGGWLFSGNSADTAPIPVGTFLAALVADFSSSNTQLLPDFITTLELQHISVTFDTATKNFAFRCEMQFEIDGRPLLLTLRIALVSDGAAGYKHTFSGTLIIGSLKFVLVFEDAKSAKGTSSTLLAAVKPTGGINVRSLVAEISADAGALMPELTLKLDNAVFGYHRKGTDPATYLFGFALGIDLDLSTLPLVGSILHSSNLGAIKDVQALYVSAPLSADDVLSFNALMSTEQVQPVLVTKAGVTGAATVYSKGFNFAATLALGGPPVALMAGGNTAPPAALPAPPPGTTTPAVPPSGNASWYDVKKSIGPVTLDRVGVRYESGRVWLLVDADLTMAGFALGLEGLALGIKLDDVTDLAANLDGLSIDISTSALTIAGGFMRFGSDYIGQAKVQAGTFGLTAIGGYSPSQQSFFIFVRLTAPLGGPPYFFITGLAGGFGLNRDLILPPIDSLTTFGLLPSQSKFPVTLDSKDPGQTLTATLADTESYIPVKAGANWVAAGIDFSSFEMVDCSALVTVAFGVELSIALLGIGRVTVPKGSPSAIVYLEITLMVRIKPAAGLLAVDARLTPASYVYTRDCRVTGGFAFYLWFGGEHEGDFVVSVGGYHPRFRKPDYYPVVPRLQLAYKVGSLSIVGQCYMALTPHMLMAGMRMDATWDAGPLQAWFSAGVDFLLGWRPFHYEADAYVHIGVSLTIDLLFTSVSVTVHVGVDLHIWGPEFGGTASIDLDIVSFTIGFGADPRQDVLDWGGFKTAFLPAPKPKPAAAMLAATASPDTLLCTASVTSGLLRDLKAQDPASFFDWLVDADHFALDSGLLIPAKQATFNTFDLQSPFSVAGGFLKAPTGDTPTAVYDQSAYPQGIVWATGFGVLPMQLAAADFHTRHTVKLARAPEGADYTVPANYTDLIDDLAVTPLMKSQSAAMWAAADPGLNGDRLILNALVGMRLTPMAQHPDITFKADLWAMLFNTQPPIAWLAVVSVPDKTDSFNAQAHGDTLQLTLNGKPATCTGYQLSVLTDATSAATRTATITGLNALGFAFAADAVDIADLAQYPLWDWPMLRTVGEERPL
jgi:hypothetical protein